MPKLTEAQAQACAALSEWDDLAPRERQEADRLQAELDEYDFYERLAQATAAAAPKPRRSPAATRNRQSQSRRCPRAADGDGGDDADDADGDDEADRAGRAPRLGGAT